MILDQFSRLAKMIYTKNTHRHYGTYMLHAVAEQYPPQSVAKMVSTSSQSPFFPASSRRDQNKTSPLASRLGCHDFSWVSSSVVGLNHLASCGGILPSARSFRVYRCFSSLAVLSLYMLAHILITTSKRFDSRLSPIILCVLERALVRS